MEAPRRTSTAEATVWDTRVELTEIRPITEEEEVLFLKSTKDQILKRFIFNSGKTGNTNGGGGGGAPYANDLGGFRKPSRLEALPGVGGRGEKNRKKSGPAMLNTMGTF